MNFWIKIQRLPISLQKVILNVDIDALARECVLQMVPVHCMITNREPGASVFSLQGSRICIDNSTFECSLVCRLIWEPLTRMTQFSGACRNSLHHTVHPIPHLTHWTEITRHFHTHLHPNIFWKKKTQKTLKYDLLLPGVNPTTLSISLHYFRLGSQLFKAMSVARQQD